MYAMKKIGEILEFNYKDLEIDINNVKLSNIEDDIIDSISGKLLKDNIDFQDACSLGCEAIEDKYPNYSFEGLMDIASDLGMLPIKLAIFKAFEDGCSIGGIELEEVRNNKDYINKKITSLFKKYQQTNNFTLNSDISAILKNMK